MTADVTYQVPLGFLSSSCQHRVWHLAINQCICVPKIINFGHSVLKIPARNYAGFINFGPACWFNYSPMSAMSHTHWSPTFKSSWCHYRQAIFSCLRFSFCWSACAFINYIYLLIYRHQQSNADWPCFPQLDWASETGSLSDEACWLRGTSSRYVQTTYTACHLLPVSSVSMSPKNQDKIQKFSSELNLHAQVLTLEVR